MMKKKVIINGWRQTVDRKIFYSAIGLFVI